MKMLSKRTKSFKPVLCTALFLLLTTPLTDAQANHRLVSEKSAAESSVPGYFERIQDPEDNTGNSSAPDSFENTQVSTGTITEEANEDFETDAASDNTVFTDSQGITYDLDGDACYVSGYTKDIKSSVSIPEELNTGDRTYTVKGVQKQAFLNCRNIEKIKLPNSLNEIPKGTFSGCRNFTSLSIVPVKYSLYKNGNTSSVKIRVNSVLFGEAENVRLEIPKTLVTELAAQKATDTIAISVQAAKNSDGARYAVPQQVAFDADAASALSKCGKSLKVKLLDTDGKKHEITMEQSSLKQVGSGLKLKLRQQKPGSTSGTLKSDLQKALKKNNISEHKVLVCQTTFASEAKPGADLVLPVEKIKAMQAGSKVYVYRYSESKRDFLTVLYHPAAVSKQGNLRLSLDKGGVYVLSAKPFQYMCRKLTNTFITETGSTYYIDKNGQPVCGWKKLGESYYYFDRENAKMASGCTVDGIRLKKSGQAVETNANVQKIQTMIKARNIVLQVTKPSDTLEQKIKKCFLWVFQFPYRQYRRLNPIYRQPGWEVTFANDIFDRRQGCCVSEAAATAFLFHECGCKTVYVATDTGHAWVELNGRVYDPLFAEARGFSNYYNRPYAGYGMYAVVKHKI